MKKFLILFAAGALMLMTACNEKPAKNDAEDSKNPAPTEQVDSTKAPKVNVEKAAPTDDGKVYVINSKAGAEQLTIMDNKNIVYNGGNGK